MEMVDDNMFIIYEQPLLSKVDENLWCCSEINIIHQCILPILSSGSIELIKSIGLIQYDYNVWINKSLDFVSFEKIGFLCMISI